MLTLRAHTGRLPVRPLPPSVQTRTVYMFYFGKRGGGIPSRPVPFEAPNDLGLAPGDQADLWYFDESPNPGEAPNDWRRAGTGTVSPNGRTIVTDPGVGIPKFCCGATLWSLKTAPATGPKPGNPATDGEPVDLGTGLFVPTKTDLFLPDILPLSLTRTYRPADTTSRPFGIGMTHPWAIFLSSPSQDYQQVDLILPDGGRVHYVRISPGTGSSDAVLEHTATPTRFYKSRIAWNATIQSWDLTLPHPLCRLLDPGPAPAQDNPGPEEDRDGTLAFTPSGRPSQVRGPGGVRRAFSARGPQGAAGESVCAGYAPDG